MSTDTSEEENKAFDKVTEKSKTDANDADVEVDVEENLEENLEENSEEISETEQETAGDSNESLPLSLPLRDYPFDRRFSEMPLRAEIVSALLDKGYRSATRIQQAIIENCSSGNDWWISANLSSNRSIAFGACFCERAWEEKKKSDDKTSVLIISMVPEVRRNFGSDIQEIAMFTDLNILSLKEKLDGSQKILLSEKPNIIIAAPQDILILSAQGIIDLSEVSLCFLDEAEKFFRSKNQEILEVLGKIPEAQLVVQSSYYKEEIRNEIENFRPQLQPTRFSKKTEENECSFWGISEEGTVENILRLLQGNIETNSIIFASSHEEVEELAIGLSRWGYSTDILCKDSHFKQKERALRRLSENSLQILVATSEMFSDISNTRVQQIIVVSEMTETWWNQLISIFTSNAIAFFGFGKIVAEEEFSPYELPSKDTGFEQQKRQLENILLQDGLRSGFLSYLEIVDEFSQTSWGKELLAIALTEVVQKHRAELIAIQEDMLRLEKKDLFFANRRKHHRNRKPHRKKR